MATVTVNGVRLYYELAGAGEIPLVLVHGAWTSHRNWDQVTPLLAGSFRVLRYDRRGHSQSERPPGQGSILEDAADLAALLADLDLAPAWVAGNSSGAAIALRLAGQQPELLQGVIAHEPGFFALLAGEPEFAPVLQGIDQLNQAVAAKIGAGAAAEGARHFVDAVLGAGAWDGLPPAYRQVFVENAPTFVDDMNDPEHFRFDLESLAHFSRPVLLSTGETSLPLFPPIVARLAAHLPQAQVLSFPGAGHSPHNSHPEAYVDAVTGFVNAHMA
jgi:pimeloyl-ACP methyl ester carboxylesterase